MKHLLPKLSLVACIAIISCVPCSLHAQTPAYATSGTETDLGAYGISGIEFTLNLNINVTALGFTALSLGGGDTPQVTLWQVGVGGALTQIYTTGDILSQVTSTGQGTQSGAPSFVSVGTPLALSSGDTYLVTAPAYWASTFDAGSGGVTVAGGVFSSASFVTTGPGGWNGWSNAAYLGGSPNLSTFSPASSSETPTVANFEFTAEESQVPEPSTYALLGAGLAMLVLVVRRQRARLAV